MRTRRLSQATYTLVIAGVVCVDMLGGLIYIASKPTYSIKGVEVFTNRHKVLVACVWSRSKSAAPFKSILCSIAGVQQHPRDVQSMEVVTFASFDESGHERVDSFSANREWIGQIMPFVSDRLVLHGTIEEMTWDGSTLRKATSQELSLVRAVPEGGYTEAAAKVGWTAVHSYEAAFSPQVRGQPATFTTPLGNHHLSVMFAEDARTYTRHLKISQDDQPIFDIDDRDLKRLEYRELRGK